jgi:DNA-binding NarL/FixJ family response regulator
MDNLIRQDAHSETLPIADAPPRSAHPLSVLIADDSEPFRANLKSYLLGVPDIEVVGEAGNGMRAIYLAQSLKPDLILLDIAMPGVAGPEAAQVIRKISPDSGIVFITMHEEKVYSDMAAQLNVDGCIAKRTLKQHLPGILERFKWLKGHSTSLRAQGSESPRTQSPGTRKKE